MSVSGGNIQKDINEDYKCVTETWMRANFDDRVREWFPLKNENLVVKLEVNKCVDDYDKAKSMNIMPFLFRSYILSLSKRLVIEVINQMGGFF